MPECADARQVRPLRLLAGLTGLAVSGALVTGLAISPASAAPSAETDLPAAAQSVQSAAVQLSVAENEVRDATKQAQQLAYAVVVLRAQLVEAQVAVTNARSDARHAIRVAVDAASVDPTATLFATLSGDDPDLATRVEDRRVKDVATQARQLQQAVTRLTSLTSGTESRQTAALAAGRRAVVAADKARTLLAAAERKQTDLRKELQVLAQRAELERLNQQLVQTLAAIDAADKARASAAALVDAPGSSGRTEIIASSPAELQALFKRAAAATCPGLPWPVLAGISQVETGNGQNKNVSSAGAMGPMQFMPATWAVYGIDGDGDGKADILDQADAVYSAGHYLCAAGGGNKATLYQAVFAYNHSDFYVNTVLGIAAQYKA